MSGFAALIDEGSRLADFREVARLGGLGSELYACLDPRASAWSDLREGVVSRLFEAAIQASPHRHDPPENDRPCPACSLFAAPAYINFALLKLTWMDLDGAENLLRPAVAFAPRNEHAAANLGYLLGRRADQARHDDFEQASTLLREAADLYSRAIALRLLAAARGSIQAMRAAYGDPKPRKTGRDVISWEHQDAVDAIDKIGSARRWFITELGAIAVAVGLTWYWPAEPATFIRADFGAQTICGTLVRADRQTIVVKEDGAEKQRPVAELESLAVVAACD